MGWLASQHFVLRTRRVHLVAVWIAGSGSRLFRNHLHRAIPADHRLFGLVFRRVCLSDSRVAHAGGVRLSARAGRPAARPGGNLKFVTDRLLTRAAPLQSRDCEGVVVTNLGYLPARLSTAFRSIVRMSLCR